MGAPCLKIINIPSVMPLIWFDTANQGCFSCIRSLARWFQGWSLELKIEYSISLEMAMKAVTILCNAVNSRTPLCCLHLCLHGLLNWDQERETKKNIFNQLLPFRDKETDLERQFEFRIIFMYHKMLFYFCFFFNYRNFKTTLS